MPTAMAKTWDELCTMVGFEKAPIDEAKTIITTSLVSNHVNPLFDNPKYYIRIPLHTIYCGNTVRHFMDKHVIIKLVLLDALMEHLAFDVAQLSQYCQVPWQSAIQLAMPMANQDGETATQSTPPTVILEEIRSHHRKW